MCPGQRFRLAPRATRTQAVKSDGKVSRIPEVNSTLRGTEKDVCHEIPPLCCFSRTFNTCARTGQCAKDQHSDVGRVCQQHLHHQRTQCQSRGEHHCRPRADVAELQLQLAESRRLL